MLRRLLIGHKASASRQLNKEEERKRPKKGQILTLINPKITRTEGEPMVFKEGCLSFPGIFRHIKRPPFVDLQYWDENGHDAGIIPAEGILARVIQHEMDHLSGVLFTDHEDVSLAEI